MAVAITPYTDADKIRARLGVDMADVDDDTMVAFQLDIQFKLNLSRLEIDGDTIKSDAAANLTDADIQSLWMLLQMYAASWCAMTLAEGRDMLFPMLFKDGKAETRRFAKTSLANIVDKLKAETKKWEDQLLGALDLPVPVAGIFNPLAVAVPDIDPVTTPDV